MLSRVAVLIPCYNESQTLALVIADFKKQLPQAPIYVYDNGSTDLSVNIAKESGASVKHVAVRGKGQVVRRMFADIDADIYVLVDGDATYDASCVHQAIEKLQSNNLDMVVCVRKPVATTAFPIGHQFGNAWFNKIVGFLFGKQFSDIFSGYRIFSRRFVKSFPAVSQGFEIEAEMTVHALQLHLPIAEVDTSYRERPAGSSSKLSTIRDGLKIFRTIFLLFLYLRPMVFFGGLFLVLTAASLLLGLPLIITYMHTGLVPRIPTAILASALAVLSCLSLTCGIILDSLSQSRLEAKRCWYLLSTMWGGK